MVEEGFIAWRLQICANSDFVYVGGGIGFNFSAILQ